MPSLTVKEGWNPGAIFEITEEPVSIGRSSGACTIVLRHDFNVSRVHAILALRKDGRVLLRDQSKNGTFLNGSRVQDASLTDKDEIQIGRTRFSFSAGSAARDFERDFSFVNPAVRTIIGVAEAIQHKPPREDAAALARDHARLQMLFEITQTLSSQVNLSEVLGMVMEKVMELFRPDEAFLLLRDKSGELVPKIVRTREGATKIEHVAISRAIMNRVLQEEVAVLSSDAQTDARFGKGDTSVLNSQVRSFMCAPLKAKSGVLGMLHLHSRRAVGAYNEDDLRLLSGVSNQAAMALENARLYATVNQQAKVRANFERFLSPNVVEQIVDGSKKIELGGKSQEVTVLFSDIRGYTALSEKLSADQMIRLLNEYFQEMTAEIFRFEGSLDKFIGDALLAVFGSPFRGPDDSDRAIQCALAMQEKLKRMNAEWAQRGQPVIEMGIGINTGVAALGMVGSEQRMEFTVIGDVVNTASRLCGAAGPGQILVARQTIDRVQPIFDWRALDALKLKGKEKEFEVVEVRGLGVEAKAGR
ncbi:MAG: FHA domain-containing protein [Candidatus Brocadiae bacterium]|nr:FHA domain-containing protein [Candidatus Brocadiia bacterium]